MTLRRIALGAAVAVLVAVSVLAVVGPVLERERAAAGPEPRAASGHVEPMPAEPLGARVPRGWRRVSAGHLSYAVPPAWHQRPPRQRVAYREDGAVIASGRAQTLSGAGQCPLAWAVVADPVRSRNVAGVAEATALAWARGYAGLPAESDLAASRARPALLAGGAPAMAARVRVDVGAAGCAGERAELTAVAVRDGGAVATLVVARYLGVRGAPGDAAYDGVLGSLVVP